MEGRIPGTFATAALHGVIALAVAVVLVAALAAVGGAHAQTAQPQFLMTWRASNSYAPPSYAGKILPNQTSQITASLELVSRNGSLINLAGQTIYWYLNDNLLGGGAGVQRITFRPYGEAPTTATLKVELPDYPGGLLIHEITIPVVAPQVVIDAPYPQGAFSASPAVVRAIPYFWNATSAAALGFSWSVNGQTVTDATNPQSLQVSLPQNTPAGFAVTIALTAENAYDSTAATANATLTYQPRP